MDEHLTVEGDVVDEVCVDQIELFLGEVRSERLEPAILEPLVLVADLGGDHVEGRVALAEPQDRALLGIHTRRRLELDLDVGVGSLE